MKTKIFNRLQIGMITATVFCILGVGLFGVLHASSLATSPAKRLENRLRFGKGANSVTRRYAACRNKARKISRRRTRLAKLAQIEEANGAAELFFPSGIFLDSAENLYIADSGNHRILRVDAISESVSTVAGDGFEDEFGEGRFSGDEGPATEASLNDPMGLSVDSAGNIYIADSYNHRIRKVDAQTGIITTVAGDGFVDEFGYGRFSGDGGPATEASLAFPSDVFVDGEGNVYIADTENHRIRKVDTTGTITTVAGDGFMDDFGFGRLTKDGSPATEASLNLPSSIAVDAEGVLYLSDMGNNRIRKVDTEGILTTVAGTGEEGISEGDFSGDDGPATEANLFLPTGLFVDGVGQIFFADTFNSRIRKVDAEGMITTVAGIGEDGMWEGEFFGDGGPATDATLAYPMDVCVDGWGRVYIVDTDNSLVHRVDADSGILCVFAGVVDEGGDGEIPSSGLDTPTSVFVDAFGALVVVDWGNSLILKMGETGEITTVAGGGFEVEGDGIAATDVSLMFPESAFVDSTGNIYIADTGNHRIRKVDAETGTITTVAGDGFVDEEGLPRFFGDDALATEASLSFPEGVFVDGSGNLYIADTGNHRIRKVDAETGTITTVAGDGFVDEFGDGRLSGDGGPAILASLNFPTAVFGDAAGNLYIADAENNRIRLVGTDGTITTVAGSGEIGFLGGDFGGDGGPATEALLNYPTGVFVDDSGGLYIADTDNGLIRKVDGESGIIATVAGREAEWFESGGTEDGIPATEAILLYPEAVFVDDSGDLYIADTGHGLVRRVDTETGSMTTVVGEIIDETTPDLFLILFSEPENIVADGSDTATLEASLLDSDGYLVDSGDITVISFQIVEGEGELADEEVVLEEGIARTTLKSLVPGLIVVEASAPDVYEDLVTVVVVAPSVPGGPELTMTTFAGDGIFGFFGDGDPATDASFFAPLDICLDSDNVYIADTDNHRIRMVDPLGVITTVAGDGFEDEESFEGRFSGDGGPATDASLNFPSGVFLDGAGNLYIADTFNHRIRKVDTAGTIATVAGDGFEDEYGSGRFSGDGGPATEASLNFPSGVFLDAEENLYIADTFNHRIRKVDAAGIITTEAGDGFKDEFDEGRYSGDGGPATETSLNAPRSIAVNETGDLYIADTDNHRIRMVDGTGTIATVAGDGFGDAEGFEGRYLGDGGPATEASLNYPSDVFLDSEGNLYISDTFNHRVRMVDDSGIITTAVGDGFRKPFSVFGRFSGDGEAATRASLSSPTGIFLDGAGTIYIVDSDNSRIRAAGVGLGIPEDPNDGIAGPVVLDLDLEVGDQAQRQTFTIPKVGDHVLIDMVALSGAEGIISVGARLNYDENQLAFVSFQPVDLLAVEVAPIASGGEVDLSTGGFDGASRDAGSLGHLVFEVQEGFVGETSVELTSGEYVMSTGDIREIEISDEGTRVIIGAQPGGGPIGPIALDLDVDPGYQGIRQTASSLDVGDQVNVDLAVVFGALGISGFQARMRYDENQLEFLDYQPTDLMDGGEILGIVATEGELEVNVALLDGVSQDNGSMGQVGFRILDGFSGTTKIELVAAQFDDPVEVGAGGAMILIGEAAPTLPTPDFDGDGLVGFPDFIQFAQRFGATEGESNYVVRFDLDLSGDVGFSDFLILAQAFGRPASAGKVAVYARLAEGLGAETNGHAVIHLIQKPGDVQDEVVVAVHVKDAGAVQGYCLRVAYDASALAFVGSSSSGASRFVESGEVAIQTTPQPGEVILADMLRSDAILRGEESLVSLRFRIRDETMTGRLEITDALVSDGLGQINRLPGVSLDDVRPMPTEYMLRQNYPNPFNLDAQIAYQLPEAGEVSLVLYNLLGQQIRVLAQGHRQAGYYRITWNGEDAHGRQVSSGIYVYRLVVGGGRFSAVRRMLLVK